MVFVGDFQVGPIDGVKQMMVGIKPGRVNDPTVGGSLNEFESFVKKDVRRINNAFRLEVVDHVAAVLGLGLPAEIDANEDTRAESTIGATLGLVTSDESRTAKDANVANPGLDSEMKLKWSLALEMSTALSIPSHSRLDDGHGPKFGREISCL